MSARKLYGEGELDEEISALQRKLEAERAHSENLDKSLTRVEAELKAATETLAEVNGRAQMPDRPAWGRAALEALRDIRAMCAEALTPRADGVER